MIPVWDWGQSGGAHKAGKPQGLFSTRLLPRGPSLSIPVLGMHWINWAAHGSPSCVSTHPLCPYPEVSSSSGHPLDVEPPSPPAPASSPGGRTQRAPGSVLRCHSLGWAEPLVQPQRNNLIKGDVDLIRWEFSLPGSRPGSCPRHQRELGEEEEGGGRKAGHCWAPALARSPPHLP